MASLQIKNVPDEVLAEVKRRAAQRHLTLRDYLLELIVLDQRTPTVNDWLASLPRGAGDITPEQVRAAIDDGRAGRDEELMRARGER